MDGVFLVGRGGALRLKMFGFGGLTVHDSLWVGRPGLLRGWVQRPFSGPDIEVALRPGESIGEPEAVFGRALWSLWQSRCAAPPKSEGADWFLVDPESAQLAQRRVRVGATGVEEERLKLWGAPGESREIRVRYSESSCVHGYWLPQEIDMEVEGLDWRAKVRVLEQRVEDELDHRLFSFPDDLEANR